VTAVQNIRLRTRPWRVWESRPVARLSRVTSSAATAVAGWAWRRASAGPRLPWVHRSPLGNRQLPLAVSIELRLDRVPADSAGAEFAGEPTTLHGTWGLPIEPGVAHCTRYRPARPQRSQAMKAAMTPRPVALAQAPVADDWAAVPSSNSAGDGRDGHSSGEGDQP
jgi:hypothetical protein